MAPACLCPGHVQRPKLLVREEPPQARRGPRRAREAAGRPSAQRPSHRPRTLLTAPGLSSPGAAGSFRKAVTALQKAQDPVGTEQVSEVGDTKEISVCEAQGSNLKDFKNGRF